MIEARRERLGVILIFAIAAIAAIIMLLQDSIPQDVEYHEFSDDRTMFAIPNFWNVVSNAGFLLVGLLGVRKTFASGGLRIVEEAKPAYFLLFLGIGLVALGSGYYHLSPSNGTLLWDRLPMTIAFMALFSIIIGEYILPRLGKMLLIPLLIVGGASVVYWHFTEMAGAGDLRLYALVQFLPILIIPVILLCFRSRFDRQQAYWWLLGAYIAAKLFEWFDAEVLSVTRVLSGHPLKHLLAALGLYVLLISYQKRVVIR